MEDAERGMITSVVSTLAPLYQITVAWSVPLIQHVRFRESPTILDVVVEGRVTWGGTLTVMTASASTTPSSFSAMQRYRPPSTAVTGPTESAPLGNRRVEDGNDAEDDKEECTRTQEMEGVGWPVAAHSRMTVSPTMTSVSVGVRVMLGGVGAEVGSVMSS